jgi:uncharacterized membrane protein YeiH
MIFKLIEKNFQVTLFIFDSFGLGLFTIIGVQKGLNADLHPVIGVVLGTITVVSEVLSEIYIAQ